MSTCRHIMDFIMTTRASERTEAEVRWLEEHTATCEVCAQALAKTDALQRILREADQERAPHGFTAAVMARARASVSPTRACWVERLFGYLKSPAPVVSLRHAMVVAGLGLMLTSFGLLTFYRGTQPGSSPSASVTRTAHRQGTQVVELEEAFVEELIARHAAATSTQPLSDNDGMRLVSY